MEQSFKEALREYEELKLASKEMEVRMDELKPIILEGIEDDQKIETDNGAFTIVKKPKYYYSEEHDMKAKELKDMEKKEVQTGVASVEYSRFVMYKEHKVV